MTVRHTLIVPAVAQVQVGADPELFVVQDGKFVPAIPYFGGVKGREEPLQDFSGRVCGGVIHDNVTVEFTIPPASLARDFADRVTAARAAIRTALSKKIPPNVRAVDLSHIGSHFFDKEDLKHPDAATFGCSEDFSAWRGAVNPKPDPKKAGTLRVAGGHIHVGVLEHVAPRVRSFLLSDYGKQEFVKLLDMTVGQYIAKEEAEGNRPAYMRRRTLYGSAGSFRPKDYGVEYRSPSSVWTEWWSRAERVFKLVQATANLVERASDPSTVVHDFMEASGVTSEEVIDSINRVAPIQRLLDLQEGINV